MDFLTRITKAPAPKGISSECWLWGKGKNHYGYGVISVSGKVWSAHRYAYHIYVGEIPEGLHVCHKCDTPACVNPEHLFLGTPADNAADKVSKGRQTKGEKNGMSRLLERHVIEIIKAASGGESRGSLAARFNVGLRTIRYIVCGHRWKHLPRPA